MAPRAQGAQPQRCPMASRGFATPHPGVPGRSNAAKRVQLGTGSLSDSGIVAGAASGWRRPKPDRLQVRCATVASSNTTALPRSMAVLCAWPQRQTHRFDKWVTAASKAAAIGRHAIGLLSGCYMRWYTAGCGIGGHTAPRPRREPIAGGTPQRPGLPGSGITPRTESLRAPPRPPPCGDRPPEGEEKHLGRPGVCFS